MISIEKAKKNQYIIIEKIEGGSEFKQKIQSMGIREKDRVFVLQDSGSGPLILMKGNIKLAIGKGMLKKIMISEI